MRRIAILLTTLILIAAACGDDASVLFDNPDGTTTATTATTGGDSGTSATTEGDSGATSTTAAGTSDTAPPETLPGGTTDDVQELLDRYETTPLRIVYRFGEGADEQIITIAQDPTRTPPVSSTLMGPGGEEGMFLTIGDTTIICGPPGEECIEMPGGGDIGQAMLGPMMSGFLLTEGIISVSGFNVEQDRQTIGGRTGLCFTFSPQARDADAEVELMSQCIDADLGFTLKMETLAAAGDGVENILELLEFGQPTPADFEPHGPVTTMPTP